LPPSFLFCSPHHAGRLDDFERKTLPPIGPDRSAATTYCIARPWLHEQGNCGIDASIGIHGEESCPPDHAAFERPKPLRGGPDRLRKQFSGDNLIVIVMAVDTLALAAEHNLGRICFCAWV
jgi:hypothetical protein